MLLDFIVWDVNPRIFSINGWGPVWYGLLFASGFLLGQQIMFYLFRKDGKPEADVEQITIYIVIATILGARLGHVLFYGPYHTPDGRGYFDNPLEILKIWEGGLASHGATISILLAIWLYSRRKKDQSFFWVVDRIVITVALGGALIRTGNLMNSEIYGKSTDVPWALVFALPESMESHFDEIAEQNFGKDVLKNVKAEKAGDEIKEFEKEKYQRITYYFEFDKRKTDTLKVRRQTEALIKQVQNRYPSFDDNVIVIPELSESTSKLSFKGDNLVSQFDAYGKLRHPTQIYEALFCIFLLILTFWLWQNKRHVLPEGVISAVFIILLFVFRILVEFLKKEQVEQEKDMISSFGLNIGQILSIPAILFGFVILFLAYRNRKKEELSLKK